MSPEVISISFKVPTALLQRVDAVARARLLSRSDVIGKALLTLLADEERC